MHIYNNTNLMVQSTRSQGSGLIVEVTPEQAGWKYIHFQARRLKKGEEWAGNTGGSEILLVILGGILDIESNWGSWNAVGERENVFSGLPHALYLPRSSSYKLSAVTDAELGLASVETSQDNPPRLIRPEDIKVEIRGGDNATRQINNILPPGSPVDHLVVCEVYTPSGGWSSYPPHKHDRHITSPDGSIVEADLEEIYYYKIDKPEGFAIQWVYTDDTSPMHLAGNPVNALLQPHNNDIVLVPEGYHPVVSPPGYTTYYLNILAGSAQVLTAQDDPRFSWVKNSYTYRNPKIPIYDVSRAASIDQ